MPCLSNSGNLTPGGFKSTADHCSVKEGVENLTWKPNIIIASVKMAHWGRFLALN
jgi:hypothetical protein